MTNADYMMIYSKMLRNNVYKKNKNYSGLLIYFNYIESKAIKTKYKKTRILEEAYEYTVD